MKRYDSRIPLISPMNLSDGQAGYKAQTTSKLEPRGSDGRGFQGPGLDHGVFIPFRIMFGLETDIPIVEVSIDSSLDPEKNWAIGKAVQALRYLYPSPG